MLGMAGGHSLAKTGHLNASFMQAGWPLLSFLVPDVCKTMGKTAKTSLISILMSRNDVRNGHFDTFLDISLEMSVILLAF